MMKEPNLTLTHATMDTEDYSLGFWQEAFEVGTTVRHFLHAALLDDSACDNSFVSGIKWQINYMVLF